MDLRRIIPCFTGLMLLIALLLGASDTSACVTEDAHNSADSYPHSLAAPHQHAAGHAHTDSGLIQRGTDQEQAGHAISCTHLHCCECEGCICLPNPPVAIASDPSSKSDEQRVIATHAYVAMLPDVSEQLAAAWARPPPNHTSCLQLQHLRTVVLLT